MLDPLPQPSQVPIFDCEDCMDCMALVLHTQKETANLKEQEGLE